jgi:hypothetical protein
MSSTTASASTPATPKAPRRARRRPVRAPSCCLVFPPTCVTCFSSAPAVWSSDAVLCSGWTAPWSSEIVPCSGRTAPWSFEIVPSERVRDVDVTILLRGAELALVGGCPDEGGTISLLGAEVAPVGG